MTTSIPLVYVAGPYRAPSRWGVEQNIRAAEEIGQLLITRGAYPIIPHANTRGYFEGAAPDELFLGGTMELLRRCDAIALSARWRQSSGAVDEEQEARRLGLPRYDFSDESRPVLSAWVASLKPRTHTALGATA